jgi:hypothetical protein
MRRAIVCSIILGSLVVGAPAHATLATNTSVQQTFFGSLSQNTPTGYVSGNFSAFIEIGVGSLGQVVAPVTRFEATGSANSCDLAWNCTSHSFPLQVINPTAYSMDAAGNSGTFKACLVPTSGPCVQFDLTITRPTWLSPQCAPVCVYPNAWYDPTTGTVGGNVFALASIYRTGYRLSGVFAGKTITPSTNGFTQYSFGLQHTSTEG